MKNIMLVCGAGMSTSLLVNRMREVAKTKEIDCKIWSTSEKELPNEFAQEPISEGIKKLQEVDCCLLGPQVRYEKKNIEQKIQELGLKVPFDVIDMRDYGTMNGKAVFEMAKKLIGD